MMRSRYFLISFFVLFYFSGVLFGYENSYYLHKKSQFEFLSSNKNAKIMMLGDSITDRGLWNELLQRCDVINRGISGDTTDGVLHRLDMLNPNLKKAYIMIGVNDILLGKRVSDIFFNYVKIINILESRHIVPIIESTLYVVKGMPPLYNEKIKKLNLLLKNYALKNGIKFMDLNLKLSPNGYLENSYSFDGLHLNAKGYMVWVKMIENF